MSAGPIRVLHLIDGLTWGGAEMLLAELADGAEAAGLALTVAYLKDKDASPAAARLIARGIQPRLVPGTVLYDPRGLARVVRHVARARPDVVHTHLGTADVLGAVAARVVGIPSFSTLHVMDWQASGRDLLRYRIYASGRRLGARVIAVSDAARDAYLDTGWDRPEHVVTVRNGTGGYVRGARSAAVRRALGLHPQDIVATMLTVLRARKGHAVSAEAVRRLRELHPDLRLLVLGDGPARDEIARMLEPLGRGAILAGHRDDVRDILDATDVLLHPTEVDALPTAIIEGMAASVPIVATAVGGIPELLEDGVTGLLIPPPATADALVRALGPLVSDAALRRRLGAAGRQRYCRDFTAEGWALRLRALYETALEENRGA